MSLRFLIGRTGSGKTAWCHESILQQLKENPQGNPIIYLVPEQMTFQSEYRLVKDPDIKGMIRAQVISFTRLAWRVLQEAGGISRFHIDQTGIHMVLRKIVEEHKQEFHVFGRSAEQFGFIEQMESMITEFKRYCITSDSLEADITKIREDNFISEHEKMLAKKLTDILVVYRQLEKNLEGKYLDGEDYLALLAEKIPQSIYLKNADIYIDGFHSFTPQELNVLKELLKHAKSVTVSLTLDKPYDEEAPYDLHLFRSTGITYQKIKQLAIEEGCNVDVPILLQDPLRFQQADSLRHLEQFFDVRPTVPYPNNANVNVLQAVNRRAEIEGIAREIISLVRDRNYRYKDIAIMVRNNESYNDLINTVFRDYEIPFFVDQKRTMLHHPLVELIRSSLEVITRNWRYESVFRCVKTDFFYALSQDTNEMREKTDKLENYCLSYGIQGSRWTMKQPWKYRRFFSVDTDGPYVQTDEELVYEQEINDLRVMIVKPLHTLEKRWKKAKTMEEFCKALWGYMEEIKLPEKLERKMKKSEEAGNLAEAREHEQVWKAIIQMMDQMVELIGDQPISLTLFTKIVESGLESLRFSLVPPAIDQVIVANFDLSRLSDIKSTFVIGVNDGVIPAKIKDDGFVSEEERELLSNYGMELAPTSMEKLLDEHFLVYSAFLTPSHHLYISYALADEEGKSLLPSTYINRLKEMFPMLKEKLLLNEPAELAAEEQLQFVHTPATTLSNLAVQLQGWMKKYPVEPLWWDVYHSLLDHSEWHDKTRLVLKSLFYKNEAKKLKFDVSRELYGSHIEASVSRMEKFSACAFSHFASYGLKLRDRKIYRLEAPDIGELFHAALKHISDRLRKNNTDWKHLSKEQCQMLAKEAVDILAPKLQGEILLSSNRFHYIKRKLETIITRASQILSDHSKASKFTPVGLELGFGKTSELPPIKLDLPNGVSMELVGRIDRVDKAEGSSGLLLRIIDYKSSSKALDLTEVYYGLALQMLTYLDIVITHSSGWLGSQANPAGVLYFHVHNPMIKKNSMISEDVIEEEIFKSFKMKGLLLGDEETVRMMDQNVESGHSKIVSAAFKKNGGFQASSSIASVEEFTHLRKYVRKTFEEIGLKISEGETSIAPYKLKDQTPCTFCSYQSFCQFDTSLEENEFRLLPPIPKNEVMDSIKRKTEGGDQQ
ncbi:helicase-exonuclease AddAB subunit AddB [Sutcliffiella rhizosphaerae]|uniref:ATP-dependent helicase/deoxyribonuclease subunit B n=1 Tax=Sutcliffiella rhizosphaerae TaxID=2880967 RepID=A0ABN8ACM4_9BACI|nr:helicase-exonuclease AddAB subunit AddB [Sutcliffiella rhizosphaerae]CAG9622981.1 ATP-dependent helicase/deoxyribonuclease subunit B [Sutcliffiella rhizosphaerae]